MYAVDITIAAETGTTAVNGFWFVARTANGTPSPRPWAR